MQLIALGAQDIYLTAIMIMIIYNYIPIRIKHIFGKMLVSSKKGIVYEMPYYSSVYEEMNLQLNEGIEDLILPTEYSDDVLYYISNLSNYYNNIKAYKKSHSKLYAKHKSVWYCHRIEPVQKNIYYANYMDPAYVPKKDNCSIFTDRQEKKEIKINRQQIKEKNNNNIDYYSLVIIIPEGIRDEVYRFLDFFNLNYLIVNYNIYVDSSCKIQSLKEFEMIQDNENIAFVDLYFKRLDFYLHYFNKTEFDLITKNNIHLNEFLFNKYFADYFHKYRVTDKLLKYSNIDNEVIMNDFNKFYYHHSQYTKNLFNLNFKVSLDVIINNMLNNYINIENYINLFNLALHNGYNLHEFLTLDIIYKIPIFNIDNMNELIKLYSFISIYVKIIPCCILNYDKRYKNKLVKFENNNNNFLPLPFQLNTLLKYMKEQHKDHKDHKDYKKEIELLEEISNTKSKSSKSKRYVNNIFGYLINMYRNKMEAL